LSPHAPLPIAVLVSGRGSTLQALVEHSRRADAPYRVALVLSDNAQARGLVIARDLGIATRAVPADKSIDRSVYDRALAAAVDECEPALIVLAGFMRILSADFVARYSGRILNIHPSLLPKYPGLHTHRKALAAHDATHGATVHFVTAELDGGPPVIQARVNVEPGDDETSLAARVQAMEHRIYPLAVNWYCAGRLRCHAGTAWLDGKALSGPLLYDPAMTGEATSGNATITGSVSATGGAAPPGDARPSQRQA
jgi:phosphoribosylglycinamide formyltransferase-1